MNAERLLALFERISEAPNAIPRLRRFILDLAVRGKLVEQDPQDEPAEEQLARIIEAKILRGRKERTTKKRRSELADESLGLPLPALWTTAPLADLVTVLNGRAYKQSELLDTGTPVLRVGNLFTSNKWYYSDLELEDDKYCDDGDLIFAWSASFGPFIWNGGRAIYHYHIWKLPLHSPEDLSRDYLYLYLLNKTGEIKASGHGISMVHMTKEKMERLEVPLPPFAEQHRIVAKVNELMALCDQLEASRTQREQCRERLVAASLQRLNQPSDDPEAFRSDARFALQVLPSLATTPAQIKQLRQTILNLAVRGKLVEQDPEDEPAAIWIHKRRSLPTGSIDGLGRPPFDLPSGWLWLGFSNLFDVAGGIQKTPNRAPRSNPFPYLGVSNVYRGRLDLSVVKHFELEPGELHRRKLEVGDLLIIEGNGSLKEIGRCAKWGGEIENCVHQNHVIRCRPCSTEISDFAILFLNSPWGMEIMQRLAITSSGLYSLSVGKIRKIEIPLPPLAEQHRIVAKVDELMELCDQLEQQLSQGEESRRGLLEAVLQEALAGRLPERSEQSHAALSCPRTESRSATHPSVMLNALAISDFTVFSSVEIQFSELNVIHGENGSGKTHLLKLAYSLVASLVPAANEPAGERPTKALLDQRIGAKLVGVFRPDRGKLGRLARRTQGHKRAEIDADFGPDGHVSLSFSTQSDRAVKTDLLPPEWFSQTPVFLPTRELLSVYPGFVSLYATQAIPFDEIWRDTCVMLGSPIAKGPRKQEVADLLAPLETSLGSKALLAGDRFFIQMDEPSMKVEADLVAEGYRKLTMLARLIANGSIDANAMLFWDEPEANLNPRLIKALAPLLLDLASAGVQIFVATHSLFLMRALEIERLRRQFDKAQFIGLKSSAVGVTITQGPMLTQSGDIIALDEDVNQAEQLLD